jgi:hypothetical protein
VAHGTGIARVDLAGGPLLPRIELPPGETVAAIDGLYPDGSTLIGVRAIDYRYRVGEKLAFSVFAGAARYGVETAAYGYYGGLGAQWRNVVRGFDLNLDLRASDKIARDALLPSDPASVWGDVYYQLYSANLYLSYRFE